MNERIKELAEQAGFETGYNGYNAWYNEKFAELIVRECADICMEMSDSALAKDCAYWIKKDFGVEE